MAAIVPEDGFSLATLQEHCGRLPAYARPVFVRLCDRLELTGTFKLNKAGLAKDGWRGGGDPVWLLDRATGRFVPLDEPLRACVEAGTLPS